MGEVPLYEFKSQAALDLKDLAGILQDLNHILDLLKLLTTRQHDDTINKALLTASLITYRRCFIRGARSPVTREDIAAFGGEAVKSHDYLMALAQKFAAHSVNPFEQIKVGVGIIDGEVNAVGTLAFHLHSLSEESFRNWGNLILSIRGQILRMGKEAESRVLAEARKRPIRDITRASQIRIDTPESSRATERRDD